VEQGLPISNEIKILVKNFFYIYILYSEKDKMNYFGYSSNLDQRLKTYLNAPLIENYEKK